jgi:Type ISP C-terminal specificity domain
MAKIFHADLFGSRQQKDSALSMSTILDTTWTPVEFHTSSYLLIPQDISMMPEYHRLWKVSDIFNVSGDPAPGFMTTHDKFAISWTAEEAIWKVEQLLASSTEEVARKLFRLCSQDQWQYHRAKRELENQQWHEEVIQVLYRPFDLKWTVFNRNVAVHRRERVNKHMLLGDNLALITSRLTKGETFQHVQVTDKVAEIICMSPKTSNNAFVFPLYVYPETEAERIIGVNRRPNLSQKFLDDITTHLGYTPTPEIIFQYIYAILHSPEYRNRYAEFLKRDFPRIPLTRNNTLFCKLAEYGEKLIELHLMKSPILNKTFSPFIDNGGSCIVEHPPKYESGKVVINKQKDSFMNVPEDVWNFHVGGYQVCQKWLKDRKGRTLSQDDIGHYQKIVIALGQSIDLMAKIDAAIPNWPIDSEYN